MIILDDTMVELKDKKYKNIITNIYTKGRHFNISLISIEQDLYYTEPIQRRNSDYFIFFNGCNLKYKGSMDIPIDDIEQYFKSRKKYSYLIFSQFDIDKLKFRVDWCKGINLKSNKIYSLIESPRSETLKNVIKSDKIKWYTKLFGYILNVFV